MFKVRDLMMSVLPMNDAEMDRVLREGLFACDGGCSRCTGSCSPCTGCTGCSDCTGGSKGPCEGCSGNLQMSGDDCASNVALLKTELQQLGY